MNESEPENERTGGRFFFFFHSLPAGAAVSCATSAVDGSSKATLFLRADTGFFFFIDGSKSISSSAAVVVVAISSLDKKNQQQRKVAGEGQFSRARYLHAVLRSADYAPLGYATLAALTSDCVLGALGRKQRDFLDSGEEDMAAHQHTTVLELSSHAATTLDALHSQIFALRTTLEEASPTQLDESDRDILDSAISDTVSWLNSTRTVTEDDITARVQQLDAIAAPIVSKIYDTPNLVIVGPANDRDGTSQTDDSSHMLSEVHLSTGEDVDYQMALELNRQFRQEEDDRSYRQAQVPKFDSGKINHLRSAS